METNMLVLALDYARLALDYEQDFIFFEHDWLNEVSLVFETVLDFINFGETWLANHFRLRDSLARFIVQSQAGDIYVVDLRPIAHHSIDEIGLNYEDRAIRKRY